MKKKFLVIALNLSLVQGPVYALSTDEAEKITIEKNYLSDLKRRVRSSWYPPMTIVQHGAIVMFNLSREGKASNVRLTVSSSRTGYDLSCIKAITTTVFAKTPDTMPDPAFIDYTFVYGNEKPTYHSTLHPSELSIAKIQLPQLTASPGPWHKTNLDKTDVAEVFARYFFVVGTSKKDRWQIIGAPTFSKEGSDYFSIIGPYPNSLLEFQYKDAEMTDLGIYSEPCIKRIRVVEQLPNSQEIGRVGEWQSQNLRVANKPVVGRDFCILYNKKDPAEIPSGSNRKFSTEMWTTEPDQRSWLAYDLTHSYPLIGMPKDELHKLLGISGLKDIAVDEADSLTKDTEVYSLSATFNREPNDFNLQFAFADDRVVAFRTIILSKPTEE